MMIPEEMDSQPKQVGHWLTEKLRDAILEGQLAPGDWLREERLAQEYRISQTDVREALKKLQAEGLVEHIPYSGVRVVAFSADDVEDLYAVRSYLEGLAASSTAINITEGELEELQNLHEQMSRMLATEQMNAYSEINRRFHLLLIKSSRRAYLIRTINQIWSIFPNMLWSSLNLTADRALPQRDDEDADEHAAILQALKTRDSEKAQTLVHQHVKSAGQHLVSAMRQAERPE